MEIITAAYALPMTNGCPVIEDGAIADRAGTHPCLGNIEELRPASRCPGQTPSGCGPDAGACQRPLAIWTLSPLCDFR